MKRKLLLILIGSSILSFTGCGPSQELQKENEDLKKQIEELQGELKQVNASYNELLESTTSKNNSSSTNSDYINPDDVFPLNDTLTLEGVCTFTFTSVEQTDERNNATDKMPAQVIRLTYDYENIGYTSDPNGLYIGSPSFQVIDEKGELADTYPLTSNSYPKSTPVGAKCVGSQEVYGLNNVSSKIKVIVSVRDNNHTSHSVTFELPIS